MAKGTITGIKPDNCFWVDKFYWCPISRIDFEPKIGDLVSYDIKETEKGKNAINVKRLKQDFSPLDKYFEELESGYFKDNEKMNLKPQLIIQYPKKLAEIFQKNPNINKSSQIRKYFDSCRLIEGKFYGNNDFDFVISELMKLVPLMNKAKERNLISQDFYEFFEKNVMEAIKSEDHFKKGFLPHFESVIGYYKH